MIPANVPADLRRLSTWLVWKYMTQPGDKRPRKIPYYVGGGRRSGVQGSPADRAKLASFDDAVQECAVRSMTGVGLAMLPENRLVGLDFDNCIADGVVRPDVSVLIAGTYAEKSPSGNGVRAFFMGELPDKKSNNIDAPFGFETFHSKGFLTVTGEALPESVSTIAPLPQRVQDFAKQRFGKKCSEPSAGQQQRSGKSIDEIREFVFANRDPSAPEPEWRKTIRMIQFETGSSPDGFALADEWSAHGANYTGSEAIESRWNSPSWNDPTRPSITLATLKKDVIAALGEFPISQTSPGINPNDPNGQKVRSPFEFGSLPSDILERHFPQRVFAIFPYFPQGTVAFLLSIGGYGKSYLLLLIAICKAAGLPHFTRRSCAPGRVVILTAEDDSEEVQRRAQKVLRYLTNAGAVIDHELLHANLHIVDLTGLGAGNFLVKSERDGAAITSLSDHIAAQIGTAEIIAIDTQSRFSGAPENDNTAGAAFVSACEGIAKKTGASVIVLAHTGKQVAREGIVDQYVSRGASSLSDNARSVVVLAPPDKEAMKQFELDAGAVARGEIFRLVHVKSNYAKKATDVFLERREDGVVAPYTPWPKASATEDDLAAKLIAFVGLHEIKRSDVRNKFATIFGTTVIRDKAMEVFEHTKATGWLTYVRTHNQSDYFKVNMASDAARAAMLRLSPHYDLAFDLPEGAARTGAH